MGDHALLSPSSAQRWLTCTPSARLEDQFPDSRSSAASEGTLAHALGELLIRAKLKLIPSKAFAPELDKIKADSQFEPAMYEYMDTYGDYVVEQFNAAIAHTKDAKIFLEQRLDMTEYVPEGFGTGDVVIIADGVMDIIDLKYGKGVPVYAERNKQMMLYTLGALREFDFLYDLAKVRMTIYQPRLDTISTYELEVTDLRQWAEEELKPMAALAFEGKGEFAPGEHCRFCKAKAVCKANADFNMQIAKYDFANPPILDDASIADILARADLFTKWIAAVEEHALNEAVNNGKHWPGWKLVEGRSNRQYADQGAVETTLLTAGIPPEKIYAPKSLLGITAMEKAIGKTVFNSHLTHLIIKPAGKPALVPESDKRPEYNSAESAQADFATA